MSIFSKTPRHRQKRNAFNLSYGNKFTMKSGLIYPMYLEECCPGDIFNVGSGMVIRSQPTIAPVYSTYYAEMRYFYVPNRLVWDGFKEFLMDQKENTPGIVKPNRVHPYLSFHPDVERNDSPGTLYDFVGVPVGNRNNVNALPFRAYNLIWNEYFRDQNLQKVRSVPLSDGEDDVDYVLARVNWKKDYFTSALPWTQRGQEVDLPALVKLRNKSDILSDGFDYQYLRSSGSTNFENAGWSRTGSNQSNIPGMLRSIGKSEIGTAANGDSSGSALDPTVLAYIQSTGGNYNSATSMYPAFLDPAGTLGVDVNIRDLRFATAVQRFLEKEAQVGGGRYADFIRGIYGVNIGDATLQRPLYLGGGRQAINISPVEQTSQTTSGVGGSAQGTLAGKGYMSGLFKARPTLLSEHGWVIGLLYIRPEILYYRGLNRHLSKENRFDYLIPGFQHLGEQEILNKEVYCVTWDNNDTEEDIAQRVENDQDTFGYTSRQAEYKSHAGEIHGGMKSDLHHYVVARDFADHLEETPPLNSSLVACEPDEEEIFAVSPTVADPWIVDGLNVCQVQRDLEKFPAYGL